MRPKSQLWLNVSRKASSAHPQTSESNGLGCCLISVALWRTSLGVRSICGPGLAHRRYRSQSASLPNRFPRWDALYKHAFIGSRPPRRRDFLRPPDLVVLVVAVEGRALPFAEPNHGLLSPNNLHRFGDRWPGVGLQAFPGITRRSVP